MLNYLTEIVTGVDKKYEILIQENEHYQTNYETVCFMRESRENELLTALKQANTYVNLSS